MTKKNYFLIGLVLVLAGIYVIYFTDWFRTKPMHITCTRSRGIRNVRGASSGTPANQVFFNLSDSYELTEIKVVPLAALKTNKLAQPVWHLIGDPSSDATSFFTYGQRIDGMSLADDVNQPGQLEPSVIYRISITAGKIKGQLDFHLGPPPANTATNPVSKH